MKILAPLATFGLALIAAIPATLAVSSPAQDGRIADAPATEAVLDQPITVIAIRHGEKGDDDARDPSLSEAGSARALELAAMLEDANVTHVFTTPYKRTTDTVTPLAKAAGLKVEVYSPAKIGALIERLGKLPSGSVALVAGHSNTTPGLVIKLGGTINEIGTYRGGPSLGEEEFNRMFVITLATKATKAKSLELRYGAAGSH